MSTLQMCGMKDAGTVLLGLDRGSGPGRGPARLLGLLQEHSRPLVHRAALCMPLWEGVLAASRRLRLEKRQTGPTIHR
jgi:hypothetical protein